MVAPHGAARRAEYCAARRGLQVHSCRYHRHVRIAALVLGILLVVGGLVWIAQGLDLAFAPRSFMTADQAWVLYGAITAVAGAALVGWARSRDRSER